MERSITVTSGNDIDKAKIYQSLIVYPLCNMCIHYFFNILPKKNFNLLKIMTMNKIKKKNRICFNK